MLKFKEKCFYNREKNLSDKGHERIGFDQFCETTNSFSSSGDFWQPWQNCSGESVLVIQD